MCVYTSITEHTAAKTNIWQQNRDLCTYSNFLLHHCLWHWCDGVPFLTKHYVIWNIKVADINQQRIFPQKCPSQISFIHERWMSPLLHHQLIIEVWVFTPWAEHQHTTWVLSWHQLSGFETKENKPEHLEQQWRFCSYGVFVHVY